MFPAIVPGWGMGVMDAVAETTFVGVRLGGMGVNVGVGVGVDDGWLDVGGGNWVEVATRCVGMAAVGTVEGVACRLPFSGRLQAHSKMMNGIVDMDLIVIFIPVPHRWKSMI